MGNDGSGKTTIAKEIQTFFRNLGFESIYKHEYEYLLLKLIFRVMGSEKLQKSRKEMLVEKRRSAQYLIWPIFVWFDVLLQYMYFNLFKRNSIIILDRYPFDQYLSFKYLGILTRVSEWLYLHFPKSDVNLVLVVRPEIAFERKKETHDYPLTFYSTQTAEYIQLAKRLKLPIIKTDDTLKSTLTKVIEQIFENKHIYKITLQKGQENRTIVKLLDDYELTAAKLGNFWKKYEERKSMFIVSLTRLNDLIRDLEVKSSALIKTIDDFGFIGNDIDVLVSPDDFKRILTYVRSHKEDYSISEIKYDAGKDIGKMDLFLDRGLKIDVHTYVGWGNVSFLSFEDLSGYFVKGRIFGVDCMLLDRKANAVVVALHGFEKGFLTLDEYIYLCKYFEESNFIRFSRLSTAMSSYIKILTFILERAPSEFPVFISSRAFILSYFRLVRTHKIEVRKFFRDLLLILFWRVRYMINGRLPFYISLTEVS